MKFKHGQNHKYGFLEAQLLVLSVASHQDPNCHE